MQGPNWRAQGSADLEHLINALGELPMPAAQREQALDRLSHLLRTRFAGGDEPAQSPSASPQSIQRAKLPSVAASRYVVVHSSKILRDYQETD